MGYVSFQEGIWFLLTVTRRRIKWINLWGWSFFDHNNCWKEKTQELRPSLNLGPEKASWGVPSAWSWCAKYFILKIFGVPNHPLIYGDINTCLVTRSEMDVGGLSPSKQVIRNHKHSMPRNHRITLLRDKSSTTWNVYNTVINGKSTISTGAGCCPSTIEMTWKEKSHV